LADQVIYGCVSVLAISDTVILLNLLSVWIQAEFEHNMGQFSDVGCKFLHFLMHVSFHCSSWILVAVTVERFVFVLVSSCQTMLYPTDCKF